MIKQWIGQYYIEAGFRARHKWSHFKIHKPRYNNRKNGFYRHLVWGKLSLIISQPQYETVTLCSECDSHEPIENVSYGDEGWSVCPNCRTIEGKTHEISLWDYEQKII